MISFSFLNKTDFDTYEQVLFDILADNMTVIAPTGNTREQDHALWYNAVRDAFMNKAQRQIILICDGDTVVGFFQYYTNTDAAAVTMEEIQLKAEYQGKNIFRALFAFLLAHLPQDLQSVEAYANVQNQKSVGILEKLGLQNIGMNKNGNSYRFKGSFCALLDWFKKKQDALYQYDRDYTQPPAKVRPSARAIIIQDGKILLTHETHKNVYMSPGGGVENGETLAECCVRELSEEAGYTVRPLRRFVTFNEYFDDVLYISHYFICEITGVCEQHLTATETEHGVCPKWLTVEQALAQFGRYDEKTPDHRSLYLREWTVLNRYIKDFGM